MLGSSNPQDLTCVGLLAVRARANEDKYVLELRGELDLSSSRALHHELATAYDRGAHEIVIDMHALEFMDSTGLHTLLAAQHQCHLNNIELWIVPGPRGVQRIFELTQTADLFSFVN